jgi:hypothetical protein
MQKRFRYGKRSWNANSVTIGLTVSDSRTRHGCRLTYKSTSDRYVKTSTTTRGERGSRADSRRQSSKLTRRTLTSQRNNINSGWTGKLHGKQMGPERSPVKRVREQRRKSTRERGKSPKMMVKDSRNLDRPTNVT